MTFTYTMGSVTHTFTHVVHSTLESTTHQWHSQLFDKGGGGGGQCNQIYQEKRNSVTDKKYQIAINFICDRENPISFNILSVYNACVTPSANLRHDNQGCIRANVRCTTRALHSSSDKQSVVASWKNSQSDIGLYRIF